MFEEEEKGNNYWLSGLGLSGDKAFISLDLKQYKNVTGFKIKNTKNGEEKNWGTKEFTIFGDDELLLSDVFVDVEDEVLTVDFPLKVPKLLRYIKFQIDTFYGLGGGLQYLGVEGIIPRALLSYSFVLFRF